MKLRKLILEMSRHLSHAFKEAWKGFSLLQCLWNDGRLQRKIFNGVGKLYAFLRLYFDGICDVISVTMATYKVHKNVH